MLASCTIRLCLVLAMLVVDVSSFHLPNASKRLLFTKRDTQLFTFSSSEDYPSFPPEESEGGGDDDRLSDEDLLATLGEWDETVPRFNTVHLTGRLGSSPVAKYFEDGKVVVNVSMASRRKYHYMERQHLNLQSGDEETDWYNLEIWGQQAEFVAKFVDKGARVGVIGTLQEDRWSDRETQEPRNAFKIVVRDFDVLETRAEAEARRGGERRQGGGSFSTSDGYDGGPSSAGTGGFFDS